MLRRFLQKGVVLAVVLVLVLAPLAVQAEHDGTSHPSEGAPASAGASAPAGGAEASTGIPDVLPGLVTILGKFIINAIIPLLGKLLVVLVSGLVWVSEYSDFVNSSAVVNGWVIVRDVANMFFIIVLLIIAFGTILGQEEYHYKKLLPKLLIMAVLVNFSRTMVGVMIDAAQVIMLTFVNGYSVAAAGNFANMFKINKLLSYSQESCGASGGGGLNETAVFTGALLALILIVISIITIVTVLAVLVLRIVMLWILTVLSPLAFLSGTFPQGQKYYAQWWEEFKNQAVAGPMMAFFLWLSLVSVSGSASDQLRGLGVPKDTGEGSAFPAASCTAVGNQDDLIGFIISITMLLAGVQMANQMGGAISGVAGKAKGLATRGLKLAATKGLGTGLGFLDRQQARWSGIQVAKIPGRIGEALKERREKTEQTIRDRGLRLAQGAREKVGAMPIIGRPLAGVYGSLAAPDVMIKTFLTKGFGARMGQGIMGSRWYKERYADKAKTQRDDAKTIDDGLAGAKRQYEDGKATNDMIAKGTRLANIPQDQRTKKQRQQFLDILYQLGNKFNAPGLQGVNKDDFDQNANLQNQVLQFAGRNRLTWQQQLGRRINQYESPEAGAARQWGKTQAADLRQQATKSEEKYARGEVRYDTVRENVLFQQESEALKKVDLTRNIDELIGDLERAVAKHDKFTAALLTKELAKKGNIPDMLQRFGIKETGIKGLQTFTDTVLKRAGLDESYAQKTAVRTAEHAWTAGNADYAHAYSVDPITNEMKTNSPEDAAKIAAKRWEGQNISKILSDLKPAALHEVGVDGKERVSAVAAALLARVNSESPKALGDLLRRGLFPPEIMRIMKGQLNVLRQLQTQGTLRGEIVGAVDTADVAPPGASARDLVADIATALRP